MDMCHWKQDLREYQRLQSVKYYNQKREKPEPKQFILGQTKQPVVLHKQLEPYVSLAAKRWLQQSKRVPQLDHDNEKQSSSSKLLYEKNKLGSLDLDDLNGFTASNNWLCQLPLTISKNCTLYRNLACTKYNSYLEALESTSNQLKKRFRCEYCRNVWQSPTPKDSFDQVPQTIPEEYVELATWRYQQYKQGVVLVSQANKNTRRELKLGAYSGRRLGGERVPLFLLNRNSFIVDTIEDYRKFAACQYWLEVNKRNTTQVKGSESNTVSLLGERQENLFACSDYSEKPDSLYRMEAHKKYELYLQCKLFQEKQIESNSWHSNIDNNNKNIFLSQPAVLFQRSNPAVPYHIHYGNIDCLPLFHSKVMNRFS